ncbi:MAG TPA: hypothetical protein P5022_10205 [Candidatus Paceibacterota bacterium]|nr:hypothetical protein [Candidatus Paceibacterota bacterium]
MDSYGSSSQSTRYSSACPDRNALPELMEPPYTPGKGVAAAATKIGKIGVMICADSFEKPLLIEMRDMKPDFVLIPYGWAAAETKWPEHGMKLKETVQNAARTIGRPVIGTDLVGEMCHGPWVGRVYGGQSVGADANGNILFISKDRDADLSLTTVNLQPRLVTASSPGAG